MTADGGAPVREEPSMLDGVVKAGLSVEGSAPYKMPEDDDVPGVSADGGTLTRLCDASVRISSQECPLMMAPNTTVTAVE